MGPLRCATLEKGSEIVTEKYSSCSPIVPTDMMAGNLRFAQMEEQQMKEWAKANPTRVDDRDCQGLTLLFAAVFEKSTSLVEWLVDLKGASVNIATQSGAAPLHWVSSGNMVSFFLSRGADVTALSRRGWTPLMMKAYHRTPRSVARLL